MLDREYIIVSVHPQRRNKLAPPLSPMSIPDGAENPRAIALVGVLFRIEDARCREVALVDLSVFRVDMKNRIPQYANGGYRVDSLPKHMARIVIAADRIARNRPQTQHRF